MGLAFFFVLVYNKQDSNERRARMNAVKEKAYAKINLYLDCIGKREDGFHDIVTVMHSVSLCDEITVAKLGEGKSSIRLELDGNRRLPSDNRNLAYAAAEMFLSRAGIKADILIRLDKHIPISSGLAGGSTDAAATLRALNRLYGRCFTDRALLAMAAELGSDVPYCLVGGTALCEGRGERITRLPSSVRLHTVIAVDNEHVSTPWAYCALDRKYSDFDGSVPRGEMGYLGDLESFLNGGSFPSRGLYNVFENVVLDACPGALAIKNRMLELGAVSAVMSGSGPSVFGIFKDAQDATAAQHTLAAEGKRAYCAETV